MGIFRMRGEWLTFLAKRDIDFWDNSNILFLNWGTGYMGVLTS